MDTLAAKCSLSHREFQILCELIPCVSHEELPPTSSLTDENGYRLLYQASEARYSKMKALVRASVEKQVQLAVHLEQARMDGLLSDLDIKISEPQAAVLWETASELRRMREENATLKEMNQALRTGVVIRLPSECVDSPTGTNKRLESELCSARQQISAMDLELLRMSDQRFEDDERLREYEDVLGQLAGTESCVVDAPVHPRFHPMSTCKDPACRGYARRLRNGLRQAVAEVGICFDDDVVLCLD
jgi:hypothetical protein